MVVQYIHSLLYYNDTAMMIVMINILLQLRLMPCPYTYMFACVIYAQVVETESLRMSAVKLMSKLFSSPHAEYVQDFSRGFREFLARYIVHI